ncbi:MAG: HAD hydrolase family protein [Lachnospiraceae bacterium]|nr:HAD hydrolase family protein [Lachnospiraceae bacterium]
MKIFLSDLDNTLIYSYKHNIGKKIVLVETKEGKELSFMTSKAHMLLEKIKDEMEFIPLTTRSLEQYRRIFFSDKWQVECALVANGGILLRNNKIDEQWYDESLKLIENAQKELELGMEILKNDRNIFFEVRKVDGLFVFTKSNDVVSTRNTLERQLDLSVVSVFNNGNKVYIFPEKLNKGTAVQRIRKLRNPEVIFAAGDSDFDLPMLKEADITIFPKELGKFLNNKNGLTVESDKIFSDVIVDYILNQ